MLKELILNLIFPDECLLCHQEGAIVCPTCFNKVKFNFNKQDIYLVKDNLQAVFIAGDYEDKILASLIKKFKYNFISRLGKILADFLINFWQDLEIEKIYPILKIIKTLPKDQVILIPIPLSKKRWRWRGFNQAEILAAELSNKLGYSLDLNLKKITDSPTQASLNEQERQKNLLNVFLYKNPENRVTDLSDKTIIIVDDITTTGTTLNEAAAALKKAGAKKIYGLVLAKG